MMGCLWIFQALFGQSFLPKPLPDMAFWTVPNSAGLLAGGEGEIRTPGTLLTYTRFPIVLLRPARTPLRKARYLYAKNRQAASKKTA